jgi:hypothetical protein
MEDMGYDKGLLDGKQVLDKGQAFFHNTQQVGAPASLFMTLMGANRVHVAWVLT